MTRILLNYVLPILLPFIAYGAWLVLARRKARPAGEAASLWHDAPWTWLLIAGIGLVCVGLVALALTGGSPPGAKYIAPHYEGGEIVPGRTE